MITFALYLRVSVGGAASLRKYIGAPDRNAQMIGAPEISGAGISKSRKP